MFLSFLNFCGACFLCRLPTLPLVYFPAPYPPDPLPRWGRGRFLVYFAGGFAPGTPAFNRLRHLQNLPSKYPAGAGGWLLPLRHLVSLPRGRGPSQTPPSLATDSSISPGPPSPWLPALLVENRFLSFLRRTMGSAPGCPHGGGCKCRLGSARACKGRSPLHKKTIISPPSRREGGRGDGGSKES